jgi:transcriptional regulator with XRE-family HTH domain
MLSERLNDGRENLLMQSELGEWIRRLRREAGISQKRLAERAETNVTTIERLENGHVQPRTRNLIAVLEALQIPDTEKQRVLSLLDRASAARPLRETIRQPNTGDMYHAMRLRARLSLSQAAQRLGVNKSTVSRWETAGVSDTEQRERVFTLYTAYPEEREILRRCKTLLLSPSTRELTTVEACEDLLEQLIEALENLRWFLGDLNFLMLEAQLAKMALSSDRAKVVLAKTWTFHADYLDWRSRASERDHYLQLVMQAIETHYHPDPFWFRALGMEAKRINDSGKGDARSAVSFQRQWLERAVSVKTDICILREMASYTYEAGGYEAAEKLFEFSRQAADRDGLYWGIRLANLVQAERYLNIGHPEKAERFLAMDDNMDANARLTELGVGIRVMQELKNTGGIRDWIVKGDALFEGNALEFRRPFWNKIKQDALLE